MELYIVPELKLNQLPPIICARPSHESYSPILESYTYDPSQVFISSHGIRYDYQLGMQRYVDRIYPRNIHSIIDDKLYSCTCARFGIHSLMEVMRRATNGYSGNEYEKESFARTVEQPFSIAMERLRDLMGLDQYEDMTLIRLETYLSIMMGRHLCYSINQLFDPINSPVIHFIYANCSKHLARSIIVRSVRELYTFYGPTCSSYVERQYSMDAYTFVSQLQRK